jgi:hypothetical protein
VTSVNANPVIKMNIELRDMLGKELMSVASKLRQFKP